MVYSFQIGDDVSAEEHEALHDSPDHSEKESASADCFNRAKELEKAWKSSLNVED